MGNNCWRGSFKKKHAYIDTKVCCFNGLEYLNGERRAETRKCVCYGGAFAAIAGSASFHSLMARNQHLILWLEDHRARSRNVNHSAEPNDDTNEPCYYPAYQLSSSAFHFVTSLRHPIMQQLLGWFHESI